MDNEYSEFEFWAMAQEAVDSHRFFLDGEELKESPADRKQSIARVAKLLIENQKAEIKKNEEREARWRKQLEDRN